MKNKFWKVSVILLLIMTMTIVNLIYIGKTFISYAIDDVSTNVKNIEFGAYFKDLNGEKTTQIQAMQKEAILILQIKVKQDGYFNGKIELGNANFNIKEIVEANEFVNKVEGNVITLNQINAGSTAEIEVKVEIIKKEIFDLNYLNMESQIRLEGIYKDTSDRDISVASTRNVKLFYQTENCTQENVVNQIEVITNKNMKINGKERKVVQIALSLGLRDNFYPIKSINIENKAPLTNDESYPEVLVSVHMNDMTNWKSNTKSNSEGTNTTIELSNLEQNGNIIWKEQGNEEIILTYIAKEGATIEKQEIATKAKITLYDGQEIWVDSKTNIDTSIELDNTISTNIKNVETQMYKGKLYQGIDRDFSTETTVFVDIANAHEYLEIKDDNIFGKINENDEKLANIIYKSTVINKEQFIKIFGEEGNITVLNKNGETIAKIDKDTQTDENGSIVIDYKDGQEGIVLKTSAPKNTGKIKLTHNKILKNNTNIDLKNMKYFNSISYVVNNLTDERKIEKNNQNIATVELKEPKTEAKLEINKDSLSTAVTNNIEMKVLLKSDDEEYDLYKNPTITIALPEDIEKIDLKNVEMLYEDEMKIKSYSIEGRNIVIRLEGEQTNYKSQTVEGAIIIVYADIDLNANAATKDAQIEMNYTNEKASQMIDRIVKSIKIEAPTEITTIYQIPELGIETVGQEETKTISLPVGEPEKQIQPYIEIINNKAVVLNNVTVLGVFPTVSKDNTIYTNIIEEIKLQGMENAKVYYSENPDATEDVNNVENAWKQNISDGAKVKKYLIILEKMEPQARMSATYKVKIPSGLEYNQTSTQGYEVSYTDSQTMTKNKVNSTQIVMTTGVGPKVEVALTGKVGNEILQNEAKIKAGEVIKYFVEVKNTGSEEVKNIKIKAPVPEGTTYVEAMQNYEYTGSSYYKEIDRESYENTIENIKPGEKVTREYEVRVNKDITDGIEIENRAEIMAGELNKQTNELQLIGETGNIRVSIKRITDRRATLYSLSSIEYYVMIENISSEDKNNVKVQSFLPDEFEVKNVSLITGLKAEEQTDEDVVDADTKEATEVEEIHDVSEEDVQIQDIQYNKEMNIGTLKKSETKVLYFEAFIKQVDEQKNVNFYAIVENEQNTYRSNVWQETIHSYDIKLEMTDSTQTQYVKPGDIIEYNINVKNESKVVVEGIEVADSIPEQCTIRSIRKDGEEIVLPESNQISVILSLEAGQEANITIEVIVNESDIRTEPEQITNQAIINIDGNTVDTSEEIIHIIEVSEDVKDQDDPNNNEDNSQDNNYATGDKIISGMAWFDENRNGKKDENEILLSNIKVKLLNTDTNQLVKMKDGDILEVTTNDSGIYMLSNIVNGNYIVIFEYDESQYGLTQYQAQGVSEKENSNVMMNELTLQGESKQLPSTDMIQIDNQNVEHINIGLIKLQKFDLKLDKYINRIMIQSSAETIVKEYQDTQLAKLELDQKHINGTNIVVEYKIKITNDGEIDGYVKKIVDYMPTDFKFSSELNKDWYQEGENLCNITLTNEKIKAGESKEVTLTLTKSMTENNLGRSGNVAEIAGDYNELGIKDINSTPGNRSNGENDMSTADTIISIKTGGVLFYSMISFIVIVALSVVIIPIMKKRTTSKSKKILDKV